MIQDNRDEQRSGSGESKRANGQEAGSVRPDDVERGEDPAPREAGAPPVAPGLTAAEIEASETDGKGTGGVGADAGGYAPLPPD